MSRSDLMARLLRMARLAERCEQTGASPEETIGRDQPGSEGRRKFAKGVVAATTGAAAFSLAPGVWADGKRHLWWLGIMPLAGMALVFPFVMLQMMLSGGAMGGGVCTHTVRIGISGRAL